MAVHTAQWYQHSWYKDLEKGNQSIYRLAPCLPVSIFLSLSSLASAKLSLLSALPQPSIEECPHLANAHLNFGVLSIGPLVGTWQWTKDSDVCVWLLTIDSGTCIMLWPSDGVLANGVNCALWLWIVSFESDLPRYFIYLWFLLVL